MTMRPFVKNAASPVQVSHAERKARERRQRELLDLRAVLESEPGRRVLWRFLSFCGVHETVIRHEAIAMAEAAGRQNVGHFLMAEIAAADDDAIFTMMREAKSDAAREARETAAVQTPRAEERETDGEDGNR